MKARKWKVCKRKGGGVFRDYSLTWLVERLFTIQDYDFNCGNCGFLTGFIHRITWITIVCSIVRGLLVKWIHYLAEMVSDHTIC